MKVIVTGGCGFVGQHVVKHLLDAGHNVVVVDNLDPEAHRCLPVFNPRTHYHIADVRSVNWAHADFNGAQAVVHLAAAGGVQRAARDPETVVCVNTIGTARLAAAVADGFLPSRVVLASSFSIYGAGYYYECSRGCGVCVVGARRSSDIDERCFGVRCPRCGEVGATVRPITLDARPAPQETYGASKYMQELALTSTPAVDEVILRFSSVYGRGMRTNVTDHESTIIAKIAGWVSRNESPILYEDGFQTRDFVTVSDVVAAVLCSIKSTVPSQTINVCSGRATTLLDACRLVAIAMNKDVRPRVTGEYRHGDMRDCLGDSSKFAVLLGRPPTTFTEGVREAFGT